MKKKFSQINKEGFTLIEGIIGLAIFSIIALGVYETFNQASKLVDVSRLLITSASLANEQFEIAHNLSYSDVGIISGIPSGVIAETQNITRDNDNFIVETFVQSIDDPFDGTLGGTPNDSSPADYKLMEVKISSPRNPLFKPQTFTELIAPKSLENSSTNGALFIRVFDANGQPISEANVHIENPSAPSPITINDTTNKDGLLQIVDVPPGFESYEISISKPGYSSDKTYLTGAAENPNPTKPHATVVSQAVTQTSFAIDHTANLNFGSVSITCAPIANVDFTLQGTKEVGTSPSILKYEESFSTDSGGEKIISGLEWDTYNLSLTDATYNLGGTISPIPFSLAAGSTQDVKVVAVPKKPNSLLVSVKQGGTNLPLSGVSVKITKDAFNQELFTGRGFLRQGDWSGGGGQTLFTDQTAFLNSDGNVETNDPAGEIKLKNAFGLYAVAGELTSSTFDTGSISNFYQIDYLPHDQPVETGTSSVLFQVATNNNQSTWNFLGPDGTDSSFYSAANTNINSAHNGDRYLRYKIYLSTASSTYTPDVGEINFTFSSLCVPPGQVLFESLTNGEFSLEVSKSGFQTINETLDVSSPWQQHDVTLMPE